MQIFVIWNRILTKFTKLLISFYVHKKIAWIYAQHLFLISLTTIYEEPQKFSNFFIAVDVENKVEGGNQKLE